MKELLMRIKVLLFKFLLYRFSIDSNKTFC